MATVELSGRAVRLSTPGPRPSGARDRAPGAAGPPSGQIGNRALRLGERTPAAVEKRGPYMVTRAPSIQAKLRECGPMVGGGLSLGGRPRPQGGLRSFAGPRPQREVVSCSLLPPLKIRSERAASQPSGDAAEWGRPG